MTEPCQTHPPLVVLTNGVACDGEGNPWLVIEDAHELPPFLMSVVSNTDLWLYVSSGQGLTCGRGTAERSLFPYETDDRLHRAGGLVGPVTALRISGVRGGPLLWRPFHPGPAEEAQHRLYKSILGDRLVFEATHACGLVFRYQWASCERFGFVRRAELLLRPDAPAACRVELLDGLLGVMPAGVALQTQQQASSLVNAYRRSEIVAAHPRVAVYALSARIVDRAEPAESLRANVIWSTGLEAAQVYLEGAQLERFVRGQPLVTHQEVRGRPGAYLLGATCMLTPGQRETWHMVADVARSQSEVVSLAALAGHADVAVALEAAVAEDSASLRQKLAAADAIQRSGDEVQDAHHLANVLFNCMRGGLFLAGYLAPARDLHAFVRARHVALAHRHASFFERMEEQVDCVTLVERARATQDPDLIRLVLEYLPITFSRRHGDPSRPWNAFSIRVRHPDGTPNFYYEGNWRDIFQNWEALLSSYPGFLPHVIAKFVNASTIDGFNPYRITRDGIDWEVPEADNPWSYIGYWGDHQIVYLTRLLEACEDHWPRSLDVWLSEAVFSYADVPYRLKPHAEIVANPRDTVRYDPARARDIEARVASLGADGRLWSCPAGADEGEAHDASPRVQHATLAEKLLVPVLAKLGQLVVGGGIWMNTQRPEWNDANNALAGYGLSVVTLCQLRRHVAMLARIFARNGDQVAAIGQNVSTWLASTENVLREVHAHADPVDDAHRWRFLERLSGAFSAYRARAYEEGPGVPCPHRLGDLAAFFGLVVEVLDHSLRQNRREDGLYHSYNLLRLCSSTGSAVIEPMYEMLEGQVAVLGAGVLSPEEALGVIDALFASRMYRADQQSFLLYPERDLPGFLDKNVIPEERLSLDPLLSRIIAEQAVAVAERDPAGVLRFAADFRHAGDLSAALDVLARRPGWATDVARGRGALLDTFELTFHHHAFTGRSGTMFAYEGLGSIYWHMVSKLLLAVQENLHQARARGASLEVQRALLDRYRRIKAGLGPAKTAREYGAFPTDPYSHTPAHAGAQQPGMTGQVKEEILTRRGELGIEVREGRLRFVPGTLRPEDFLPGEDGMPELRFTVAGVPVRYRLTPDGAPRAVVHSAAGVEQWEGTALDAAWSRRVFLRDDALRQIDVLLPRSTLPDVAHAQGGRADGPDS